MLARRSCAKLGNRNVYFTWRATADWPSRSAVRSPENGRKASGSARSARRRRVMAAWAGNTSKIVSGRITVTPTSRGLPSCAGEENSGPGDRAAASERLTGQSPPHPADVSSIDLQTGISKTGISVNVEPEDVPTAERPQLIPAWAGHTKPKRMAGAIRPSATSAYRIHRRSSPLSP